MAWALSERHLDREGATALVQDRPPVDFTYYSMAEFADAAFSQKETS